MESDAYRKVHVMIFGLSGTKGGGGKSTFAVNFAAALAHEGDDVCYVDMDIQAHGVSWVATRNASGFKLPTIHIAQAVSDPRNPNPQPLAPLLRSYAARYQHLVLDAGGRNSPELRAAVRVADVVVMPFLPSQFDLWTVGDMAEVLTVGREYNPNLKALALVNRASNNWTSQKAADAVAVIEKFAEHMVRADVTVHDLDPFESSIKSGRAVMEMGTKDSKALDEFYALFHQARELAA